MDDKRFQEIYTQRSFRNPEMKIFVDRQTGVNYLITMNGTSSSGITVLLNADGTPVVTQVPRDYSE